MAHPFCWLLLRHYAVVLIYQFDRKFGTENEALRLDGKSHSSLTREISDISNRKFWLYGERLRPSPCIFFLSFLREKKTAD